MRAIKKGVGKKAVRDEQNEWAIIKTGIVSLFRLSYLCLEFIPTSSILVPPYNCIAFKAHLKYQGLYEAMSKLSHLVGSLLQIVSPLQTGTILLIFLSPVAPRTVPCKLQALHKDLLSKIQELHVLDLGYLGLLDDKYFLHASAHLIINSSAYFSLIYILFLENVI